jgi:hypothetical protein
VRHDLGEVGSRLVLPLPLRARPKDRAKRAESDEVMRDRELVEAITRARHATHSELRELIISGEGSTRTEADLRVRRIEPAEVFRRGP